MAAPLRQRPARAAAVPVRPVGAQSVVVAAAADVVARARRATAEPRGSAEARLHRIRVAVKRLRSYWRLAMPHLPAEAAGAERDRLRAVAAALAPYRDADVAGAIVATLLGKTRGPGARAVLRHWAEGRRTLAGPETARQRALRGAVRQLLAVPVRLAEPPALPAGWDWLEPGLRRAFQRGRRCYQACVKGGSDEAFHAWRRRVKDLQYFTELLRFLAPHRMGQRLKRIERIADALGDAHDLVELRNGLSAAPPQRAARHGRRATRPRPALGGALRRRLEHRIALHYRAALRAARPLFAPTVPRWLLSQRAAWERWEHRQRKSRPIAGGVKN